MAETGFWGEVIEICERKLAARASAELVDELEKEWQAAGSPKPRRKWLLGRLEELFRSMGPRPRWVYKDDPDWQYHQGRPMIFVGQLDVPGFPFTPEQKSPKSTVFVFYTLEPVNDPPGAWVQVVKSISQVHGLL